MYVPAAFREEDPAVIAAILDASRIATLVTATADGPVATPMPLLFVPDEGPHGTLYGHVARANPHWTQPAIGDALALFAGPDAYVSPSWYPSKQEHGKAVPTWNYVAVHVYGRVEFFDDAARVRAIVTRQTVREEAGRPHPWAVSDAPEDYVQAMLRGIVGLRMPVARIEAKRKMSQNRSPEDRAGAMAALAASADPTDRAVAATIAACSR